MDNMTAIDMTCIRCWSTDTEPWTVVHNGESTTAYLCSNHMQPLAVVWEGKTRRTYREPNVKPRRTRVLKALDGWTPEGPTIAPLNNREGATIPVEREVYDWRANA